MYVSTTTTNTISPLLIALKSDQIAKGMSGAPVLDTEINKVVGIISDRYDSRYLSEDIDIYRTLSFAIPVESIIGVFPEIRQKNPGLLKINEFLQKIQLQGRLYQQIDVSYVYPVQYDEIKEALKINRIVFITGTPEYGKTFTAIRLLWEYYMEKYDPDYIWQWTDEDQVTSFIERLLRTDNSLEHHIIYFEDPFGKTRYIHNEIFEKNIGRIIDSLKTFEDTYIIITSREDLLREFESDKITEIDLNNFKKTLNINSYSYKDRQNILCNRATLWNCKWFMHKDLKKITIESIKDFRILPTPLNMKDFAVATINVTDEKTLLNKIDEKSKETSKSFAKEIKDMTEDKILFFFLVFVQLFYVEIIKKKYEELISELNIENSWEFDRILDLFKDDKVDVGKWSHREILDFSNPSYSEALYPPFNGETISYYNK
jgi:hypothetical protein